MAGRITDLSRQYFERIVAPFAGRLLIVSGLLTVLAIAVIATSWNINSDFKALLPLDSPQAQATNEVGERIGSGSALFVVIDSPDHEANLAFAKAYSDKLRETPSVALAHYHNDKTFFEENQLLYLQLEDLKELRKRVEKEVKQAKRRANPLFVSLDTKKPESTFDVSDIEQKYQGELAQDRYKEYLVADDGYSITIIVRFVESSTNLTATNDLLDEVERIGKELAPAKFHPEMTVELGGGLVKRKAEYDSIVSDIQLSGVATILGLFFVIGLYFRRLRAVVLILGPLVMSVLWTLAIAFSLYGELTTVTVFIFAILLGLAIDYAIHLLNAYDHARAGGEEPVAALVETYASTGRATVVGAATTFATFVVLSFSEFRGFQQFGVVASLGVLCAVVAMLAVLPSGILVFHRWRPHDEPRTRGAALSALQWGRKMTVSALVVAIGLSAVAAVGISKVRFEENFRRISDVEWPWADASADQMAHHTRDAEIWGKRRARQRFELARAIRERAQPATFVMDREQADVGDKYTSAAGNMQTSTPTVVMFDEPGDARAVYAHLDAAMNAGKIKTVKGAGSAWAFVPGTAEEQQAKVAELEAIKAVLDKEGRHLKGDDKERADELMPKLAAKPIDVYMLPDWVKRLFREAGAGARPAAQGEDFAFEYTIFLNESVDSMVGDQARQFLGDVEQLREETGIALRVGSPALVYVAMLDAIKDEGPRMMLIALVVVLLILVLAFRNPAQALLAMLPLILGAFWMFGLCGFVGVKLDFFNVIILPVVLGIGIDDGVHFYHRYLELGRGSVGRTLGEVGSAVTMTTITSTIGFGGLALTDYDGLVSIGYLAIAGIVTTWVATVMVLPALLVVVEGVTGRSAAGDAD